MSVNSCLLSAVSTVTLRHITAENLSSYPIKITPNKNRCEFLSNAYVSKSRWFGIASGIAFVIIKLLLGTRVTIWHTENTLVKEFCCCRLFKRHVFIYFDVSIPLCFICIQSIHCTSGKSGISLTHCCDLLLFGTSRFYPWGLFQCNRNNHIISPALCKQLRKRGAK